MRPTSRPWTSCRNCVPRRRAASWSINGCGWERGRSVRSSHWRWPAPCSASPTIGCACDARHGSRSCSASVPSGAPGEVWDRPVVPRDDIGVRLPDVESSDVEALVVWSVVTVCVLLIVAGVGSTWDALADINAIGLLGALLLAVVARVVAGGQLALADSGARPTADRLRRAIACRIRVRLGRKDPSRVRRGRCRGPRARSCGCRARPRATRSWCRLHPGRAGAHRSARVPPSRHARGRHRRWVVAEVSRWPWC